MFIVSTLYIDTHTYWRKVGGGEGEENVQLNLSVCVCVWWNMRYHHKRIIKWITKWIELSNWWIGLVQCLFCCFVFTMSSSSFLSCPIHVHIYYLVYNSCFLLSHVYTTTWTPCITLLIGLSSSSFKLTTFLVSDKGKGPT